MMSSIFFPPPPPSLGHFRLGGFGLWGILSIGYFGVGFNFLYQT